jgi:hypothetical protein
VEVVEEKELKDDEIDMAESEDEQHEEVEHESEEEEDSEIAFVATTNSNKKTTIAGGITKKKRVAQNKTISKKRTDTDQIRLAMTTNAAQKLREASENSTDGNTQTRMHTLERIFLGKFPIMVQSDFCILQGLPREIGRAHV